MGCKDFPSKTREQQAPSSFTYQASLLPWEQTLSQAVFYFLITPRCSRNRGVGGFEFSGTGESFVLKNHGNGQRKGGHGTERHPGEGLSGEAGF